MQDSLWVPKSFDQCLNTTSTPPWIYPSLGLPGWLSGKESSCSAGDAGDEGSIPESEGSPAEGNGNPLQYSCLENPMDKVSLASPKSWTWYSTHTSTSWGFSEDGLFSSATCWSATGKPYRVLRVAPALRFQTWFSVELSWSKKSSNKAICSELNLVHLMLQIWQS